MRTKLDEKILDTRLLDTKTNKVSVNKDRNKFCKAEAHFTLLEIEISDSN